MITNQCIIQRQIRQILGRASEKVARDLRLGSGLYRVLRFPPPLATGYSQPSCNMAEKVTKTKIPNLLVFG